MLCTRLIVSSFELPWKPSAQITTHNEQSTLLQQRQRLTKQAWLPEYRISILSTPYTTEYCTNMPTLPFRIMGLDRRSSAATSNNRSSTGAAANRYTYPGNRGGAAIAGGGTGTGSADNSPSNSFTTVLPGQPPRTGHALDTSVTSTNSAPANLTPSAPPGEAVAPKPVFRGSHVDPPASNLSQQQPESHSHPAADPGSALSTTSNNSSGSGESKTNRPGSYQVTRTTNGPAEVYRVMVPAGVRPGSEFTVHAGSRRVRVRCPPTSQPGQSLQITLPPESITSYMPLRAASVTAPTGTGGGGTVRMSEDVARVNAHAKESGGSAQTYLVTIPPNIYPGMQFTVNVAGQRFMVSCPESAGPNMRVRIVPPVQREAPEAAPKTQVFEVAVPQGVQPGQPFALVANGQRVLVTCPPDVVPGQKIRFQLPVSQVVGNIQLAYESEKGGWKRTIRVTDLKFQWVRLEGGESEGGDLVDLDTSHFDFMKSAYVRKITFMEGNDARMRTGTVELAPAGEAVVDSRLVVHNQTLLSYADIAQTQGKPLEEKKAWFETICQQLTTPWEKGHIKICVRRSHLLLDSVDAIMGLGREDMRKRWRIEFLGEPAIDAGGPTKEWFELVTEQVYDPACGLWIPSVNNQACVDINPASGT